MEKMKNKRGEIIPRSPWIAGSFFLAVMVVVGTLFLIMARTVHPLALPLVLIASMLGVSIVGAFTLRNIEGLSEKNFLKLMALTFRYLPFLRRRQGSTTEQNNQGNTEQIQRPPAADN